MSLQLKRSCTLELDRCLNLSSRRAFFWAPPCSPAITTDVPVSSVFTSMSMCAHMHILLQGRVDLCCLFNIAKNTTTLSHLGTQVIAISIIYNDIQWSRPQTILTNGLTEINAAVHKQAYPLPPLPILSSRLHLSLFSSAFPIFCFLLHSFNHPYSYMSFIKLQSLGKWLVVSS